LKSKLKSLNKIMKPVKLFDDYLNMAAAAQNMSREQYTATYLSEDKTNDVINEWGSSDQNIMNQQIHKDAGSPKKMPSPFDRKLRDAAEDAVDWHWDEWPEYKRDRDGLIDNAVRSYLRSYFPKDWAIMVRMFEPMESVQVTEGIYAKQSKIVPGEYIKTQYGYFYKRVEGKVGGQDAYVEIKNGKEGKRKTSIHDTVDFEIVDKKVAFESVVVEQDRNTLGELNDMTLGQLERIEDYAEMISDRMESGQQLDSWMFSQITVALDNLNSVHDAMDAEDVIKESQVNEKIKLIMRNILTKMIPAAFGPSTNPKMREEIKDAVKTAIEPILMKYDYIVESKESDALAKEIDKAMIKIDDSMSYEDFADAVATILRDEYGSHNYTKFLKALKDKL